MKFKLIKPKPLGLASAFFRKKMRLNLDIRIFHHPCKKFFKKNFCQSRYTYKKERALTSNPAFERGTFWGVGISAQV